MTALSLWSLFGCCEGLLLDLIQERPTLLLVGWVWKYDVAWSCGGFDVLAAVVSVLRVGLKWYCRRFELSAVV